VPDTCHEPPACAVGYPPDERCAVHPAAARPDGAPCNDSNFRTELDTCTTTSATQSTCAGIDFCIRGNVTCADPPQCHAQVPCLHGLCAEPTPTPGEPCDDGSNRTRNDTCTAAGDCVGIDLCALPGDGAVVCPEYPCQRSLGCLHGVCHYEPLQDGSVCDDGDNRTVNDTCIGASVALLADGCGGVFPDLCRGLGDAHCAPPATCHGPGACDSITGRCAYPELPVFTPCADGNPATYGDACFGGSCVGVAACVGACVSFESTEDIHTGSRFSIRRVRAGPGDWSTGLISASDVQANGSWVGVGFHPTADDENAIVGLIPAFALPANLSFYSQMTFGVLLTFRGTIAAVEGGEFVADIGAYTAGDRIALRINRASRVEFVVNGAIRRTSTVLAVPEVAYHVAALLFDHGATLERFERSTIDELCTGRVCPRPNDQCWAESTCAQGVCTTGATLGVGHNCTDGLNFTDHDACDAVGECRGVDLCIRDNVTCPPPDQCHLAVDCFRGQCPDHPPQAVGTPCADGDPTTLFDVCQTDGVCRGRDPCDNLICRQPVGECQGTVACVLGECVQGNHTEAGTPCDDNSTATEDDVCDGDGGCAGIAYCANVTCPPSTCRGAPTCTRGDCVSGPPVADGRPCDDGVNATDDDVCTAGVCAGIDRCANTSCLPRTCATVRCSHGDCIYTDAPGAPCDDGDALTRGDVCGATPGNCAGTALECTAPVVSSTVTFAPSCAESPDVLNSTAGLQWQLTATPPATGCVCYTSRGGQPAVALAAAPLSDSDCARLICTGGNFEFGRCENSGRIVARGTWAGGRVSVPLAHEPQVCFGLDLEAAATTVAVTTDADTAPSSTVAAVQTTVAPSGRVACRVTLTPSARPGTCHLFVGEAVEWTWAGAPMNVLPTGSPAFAGSGEPALVGRHVVTFDAAGDYSYTSTIFRGVVGSVSATLAVRNVTSAVPQGATVHPVAWGPSSFNVVVEVAAGDVVRWTWDGTEPHDVQGPLLSSGAATLAGTYAVQFLQPGSFEFADTAHPWMTGVVRVSQSTTTTTTTTTTFRPVTHAEPCGAVAVAVNASNAANASTGIAFTGTTVVDVGRSTNVAAYDVVNFSFFAEVTPADPPAGYLFARASLSGGRFAGLYLRRSAPRGIYLYYRTPGSSVQRRVAFPVALSAGIAHLVRLTVVGATATLEVRSAVFDFGVHTAVLAGAPDHCRLGRDPDCAMLVGARPSMVDASTPPAVWDGSNTAFGFVGRVQHAAVVPGCTDIGLNDYIERTPGFGVGLPTPSPTTPPPPTSPPTATPVPVPVGCIDLLDRLVVAGVPFIRDAVHVTAGAAIEAAPLVAGAAFTVAVTVQPAAGDSGYIVARTTVDGGSRPYALYLSAPTATVRLYYFASGRTRRVDFEAMLPSDGRWHQVLLSVAGTTAVLQVDGRAGAARRRLVGPVEDCGSGAGSAGSQCTLMLGARSSGVNRSAYPLASGIKHAVLCPNTLHTDLPPRGAVGAVDLLRWASPVASVRGVGLAVGPGPSGALPLEGVPGVADAATVMLEVVATAPGFVVARGDPNGTRVRWGVEVLNGSIRVNLAETLAVTRQLDFSADIVDGELHTVFVAINSSTVVVGVDDDEPAAAALNGAVLDCAGTADDCIVTVGRRSGLDPAPLTGRVTAAHLLPGAALSSWVPALDTPTP